MVGVLLELLVVRNLQVRRIYEHSEENDHLSSPFTMIVV